MHLNWQEIGTALLTMLIGAVASGINSVAGGGSLISFPYINVVLGLPSVSANATNTVSLWPGSISGGIGFKDHLPKTRHHLKVLALPTFLGSIVGAWLLLTTSKAVFDVLVPVLILVATVCLMLQPLVKKLAAKREKGEKLWLGVVLQFLVSTYGGYFGAGMGMMMLASFIFTMDEDIHAMNAVKNWLGVIINLAASVCFLVAGKVDLHVGLTLTVGSLIGGFAGARLSQKVPADKLRLPIVIYGFCMVGYFMFRLVAHR